MNRSLQLVSLALLGALAYLATQVEAECCYVPFHCHEPNGVKKYRCYDCSESTVFCGHGKCNVFGCDCDGGCRQGDASLWCWNPVFNCTRSFHAVTNMVKLDSPKTYIAKLVDVFDDDRNQALDFAEFSLLIKQNDPKFEGNLQVEFNKMDANKDGFIVHAEIDRDLF